MLYYPSESKVEPEDSEHGSGANPLELISLISTFLSKRSCPNHLPVENSKYHAQKNHTQESPPNTYYYLLLLLFIIIRLSYSYNNYYYYFVIYIFFNNFYYYIIYNSYMLHLKPFLLLC